MKKLFFIFILTAVVFVPFSFVQAVTQTQLSSEVQIVCPDSYGNWYSGSGTIIDSKGIILTNKHVVTDQYGGIINTCFIGFVSSASEDPDFGTKDNYNLAEVKYYTTANDMDAAILYLANPTNKTYSYINIWNSDSSKLELGSKIEVIGYPSIGGSTITYTSGDFSGFGSKSDGTQNYLKTTAILEHGNSGGAAYNSKGQFIGIPTMVISGTINQLAYILSVNSIKNWLSGVLGSDYKSEIIDQTPSVQRPETNIQSDTTPPSIKKPVLGLLLYDDNLRLYQKRVRSASKQAKIEHSSNVSFLWYESCQNEHCINDDSAIKGYYYYFGKDPKAMPKNKGKYVPSTSLVREKFDFAGEMGLGSNSKGITHSARLPEIFSLKDQGIYYFILQAIDENGNISNSIINYQYVYEKEDFKQLKRIYVYDKEMVKIATIEYPDYEEINTGVVYASGKVGKQFNEIYTNQTKLFLKPEYKNGTNGVIYLVTKNKFCENQRCEGGKVNKKGLVEWDNKSNNLFIKPAIKGVTPYFTIMHHALTVTFKTNINRKILQGNNSKLSVKLKK